MTWIKYILGLIVVLMATSSIAKSIWDYEVITLRKDTVKLIADTNKTHIIVFSNNNACRDCFIPFNRPEEKLALEIANQSTIIQFVCRVPANSASRKRHINSLMADLPLIAKADNIFFDSYQDDYSYNKQGLTGLFGDFQINRTPALIIIQPRKGITVVKYDELYGHLKSAKYFSIEALMEYRKSNLE